MVSRKIQRFFAVVILLAMVFSGSGGGYASAQDSGPQNPLSPSNQSPAGVDLSQVSPLIEKGGPAKVVVLLQQPSLVTFTVQAQEAGQQLAPSSIQAQLATIQQAQATLQAQLESPQIGAQTIFKNQRVYNGIAVKVDAASLADIAGLPGVAKIIPLETHVLDNAYATGLIRAKNLWNSASSGIKYTGEGIRVGIIDTGIDFMHTNFGGPGTGYEAAAADTANFTTLDSVFPTDKVVGGYDFAGDDYNATDPANDTPVPDPVPMDCNGHGSHVAGTAAGFGVNADGSTFTGPWTSTLDTMSLRIGPGVAPQASLYALRVFGCEGSTDLTDLAIEWAVDPNGDGDFSDHLDVINMSLGSSFGLPGSSSVLASDAAAQAGVIVVTSAGNAGDVSFISGSPGVAQRAISVAASVDAYSVMDGFKVVSPAVLAGDHPASNAVNWSPVGTDVTGLLKYPSELAANLKEGCADFPAGYFTGMIALLDWNVQSQCALASGGRVGKAAAAGAIGVLFTYQHPVLAITIGGLASPPSAITTKAVGDALKAQLAAATPVTVTLTRSLDATFKLLETSTNDMVAGFTSRGVRVTDFALKPDLAAPGMTIFSTRSGRFLGTGGIDYLPGDEGVSFNGTSMASPMVAGVMAILRELHPDWSVEELKALVMNTATQDLFVGTGQTGQTFGPTRVGAGRVDASNAAANQVVLYNETDRGSVSVSFGAQDVFGTHTDTRLVRVVNKGGTAVTYNLAYTPGADMPGASFSFTSLEDAPITSISVPANDSTLFKVKLTAVAAQLRNSRDPAMDATQLTLSRVWFADESGLLKLTGAGLQELRLPLYAAPRPASAMRASNTAAGVEDEKSGTIGLSLVGNGVDTTGGTFTGYPDHITSLVSVFELAYESPRDVLAVDERQMADLRAVGVMTDYPAFRDDGDAATDMSDARVFFGVATYGEWTTPTQMEFDVYIDTNQDGTTDYILFSTPQLGSGNSLTDIFVTYLWDVDLPFSSIVKQDALNLDTGEGANTGLFRNNVLVLPVKAADLGLTDADAEFDYLVVTWSAYDASAPVDFSNPLTYNAANPVIEAAGSDAGMPVYRDLPGTNISIRYNLTGANAGMIPPGLMLLHHHNALEDRLQIVDIVEMLFQRFLPLVYR